MAKEICISSTPHETRLAILEDDQLAEIYYERENEYTLAGSIYNGRVTRVLPGMQSAFVDLGLERDAFLYVTDFIELEDQEETDELEKAAASGAGQAPREIRHPHGVDQNGGRQEERGQRPNQIRQGIRHEHRQAEVAKPEFAGSMAPEAPATQGQPETAQESDEAGARRWRGRRRRRGGRGPGGQFDAPIESEPVSRSASEEPVASEQAPAIQASEAGPAPRGHHAPVPFVLPGESLSKYGSTPASETPKTAPEPEAPRRPANTYKPSTLVEAPLRWDGSGLLPGESLSLRRREAEPQLEGNQEAQGDLAAAPFTEFAPEETVEETEESPVSALHEAEWNTPAEAPFEFEEEELASNALESLTDEETSAHEGTGASESESAVPGETPAEPDEDADASHRIDPSAPTGFKLFGFGKKKKDGETAAGKTTSAPATPVSTYAPGNGVVEEEVIEGEEFDSTPHTRRHKPEVHDTDDYEEETLPSHLRTGDLGEMFQEAHLDHRIQKSFDEKGVEEDEVEGDEEEEASPGAQPTPGRERRDRGGRGQRGRGAQSNRRGPSRRSAQTSDLPIISDLLKSGQEILVQIAKEPIAKKGARITSHIALPGRFLVFMPTVTHVGVSRKIASDEERHRLKRILIHERGEAPGGFIVRTAAEGASEEELRADLRFLMNLWNDIKQRSESSKSPALIYHDLSLIERILRDQVSSNFASIWVDTEADYERIVRFLNRFSPSLVRRVKLYTKETPLFEHFGIQDEISKALRSKVWLKSGGSIVINQTEALVAIDINTGKYVGKSARLEDTILKTNLDAVPEIVRQIRLRDLGGIIVIDFIDMDERKNRFKVMAALEEALKNDRAPTKVLQFNDFGLVAITRKRVKQSLERTLSVPCPTCQATGMVKSPVTVCNEIYIEMRKMRKHFENADVMLRVNPETVKVLKANGNRWLTDFEELIGRNVLVKSDPTLHPEQFDIQG
ncbi:MAG: Rne/Rng family ribonuclease [Terracidiphilus sp.]|jgi:ribonuclease E